MRNKCTYINKLAPTTKQMKLSRIFKAKKTTKKLVLDKDQFSTQLEFNEFADSELKKQGIGKAHQDYTMLLDGAYQEYGISNMPGRMWH